MLIDHQSDKFVIRGRVPSVAEPLPSAWDTGAEKFSPLCDDVPGTRNRWGPHRAVSGAGDQLWPHSTALQGSREETHVPKRAPFDGYRVVDATRLNEAVRALSDVFGPVHVDPMAPSTSDRFELCLNMFRCSRIGLAYCYFKDACRIWTVRSNHFYVTIAMAGAFDSTSGQLDPANSLHTSPGEAAIFMPGRPVSLLCGEGAAVLCVALPETLLRSELEAILGHPVRVPVEFQRAMNLEGDGSAWFDLLWHLERNAEHIRQLTQFGVVCTSIERLIAEELLLVQPNNFSNAMRPTGLPPSMQTVLEAIRTSPEHAWTVADLARLAGVGVRSLQKNFRQFLGMSPLRYLREVRLHEVRERLRHAEPRNTTVSWVALSLGFTDMGRFAADYNKRFGERPSETLRGGEGLVSHFPGHTG